MKYVHFFSVAVTLFLLVTACKKDQPDMVVPDCPECWDDNMVCVEQTCQCPDGYLETWLNIEFYDDTEVVPPSGRKFCIEPDKLTFMAHFPRFECIDTFAIRFFTEPLKVNDQTPLLSISMVEALVPRSWRITVHPGLILDTENPDGIWVGIVRLYPTYGPNFLGCVDYDQNEELVGGINRMMFRGHFTHKDTISGHILFEKAFGTKAHLENFQLEGIKLVRTVPY